MSRLVGVQLQAAAARRCGRWLQLQLLIQIFTVVALSYCVLLPLQAGCSSVARDELASEYEAGPLAGTKRRYPGPVSAFKGNANLTRLLDVGACLNRSEPFVSYVPPLDGTNPFRGTLCQDIYAMKIVLFDLQLVELKEVNPVGSSFRAEIQIILHWLDNMDEGSNAIDVNGSCQFRCDNNPQSKACCDHVWVPPLRLLGCELNGVQSSTPVPSSYYSNANLSTLDSENLFNLCLETDLECYWRRLWYLTVDATCVSEMDLHSFPFDTQSLHIDILNPYASRTWLHLTKGFLKQNVGEGINSVKLSPDCKLPGWYVKQVALSSTCGLTQAWQETFLTQDILLLDLQAGSGYVSQKQKILDAFSTEELKCVDMDDMEDMEDFASPLDMDMYWNVGEKIYGERVNSTLEQYTACMQAHSPSDDVEFAWNESTHEKAFMKIPNNTGSSFSTSEENIKRSFNILNLSRDKNTCKVRFSCGIRAVANLTTPAIRVTILVQRYRMFYLVKLILPTVACVAFAFTAFGLQPEELGARLSVVVPSAIALTALQIFVVATDIPPVAYMTPSTLVMLISYFVQLLIGYESIWVNKCVARERVNSLEHGKLRSTLSKRDAPSMHENSSHINFQKLPSNQLEMELTSLHHTSSTSSCTEIEEVATSMEISANNMEEDLVQPKEDEITCCLSIPSKEKGVLSDLVEKAHSPRYQRSFTRKVDLTFMAIVVLLYIIALLLCTYLPGFIFSLKSHSDGSSVIIWTDMA